MQAEIVILNGDIHTMDDAGPHAQALAIYGNRIIAVGDNAAVRPLLADHGKLIDLQGRTVVPGFTDAHIHFLSYGLSLQQIDLAGVDSLAEAQDQIRVRVAKTPSGHWLTGRGWDQSLWETGRFPNRSDIDAVTTEHPVFLTRKCGHAGWANSSALALAAITSSTPDPPGGEIEREPASGEPTGILKEKAMDLIHELLDTPSESRATEAVGLAIAKAHSHGIVGIHNMEGASALNAFQALRDRNQLRLRVVQQIPEADLDAAVRLGVRSGFGDEFLRFGAVKIFSDGALGARTARMLEPYEGEPHNRGIALASAEHLRRQVAKAAGAGLALHIHAIGDEANRTVLDAFAAVRRQKIGSRLRHRIEHAQVLHPDDFPRFRELAIVASVQPIHATQDMALVDAHWGKRAPFAYAFRTLLDLGTTVAFGSDAPVEDLDVLKGIHAAVTRRRADGTPGPRGWNPQQRLTVREAVRAYTTGAAYSVGLESSQGKIAPGMFADLVVLSGDIFTIDPMDILSTKIVATMVGGEIVFGGEELGL